MTDTPEAWAGPQINDQEAGEIRKVNRLVADLEARRGTVEGSVVPPG